MRLFLFGGYGLALAALAFVVFGAYDSYPVQARDGIIKKSLFVFYSVMLGKVRLNGVRRGAMGRGEVRERGGGRRA